MDSNIDDVSVWDLVENDKFDLAKIRIEDGKDINSMGGYMKNIPLISVVAKKGRVDLLKLLISKGAEINPAARDPLWFAAAAGQLEAVRFLLENGAKAHESLINAAASNGSIEVIAFLMNKGFDMNHQINITVEGLTRIDTVSNTALMDVQVDSFDDDNAKQRKIGTVKFLLENGADVNAKGRFGNSALHFSANDNNVEIITLLLEAGANKKSKNDDGETAFKYADKNDIGARALLK